MLIRKLRGEKFYNIGPGSRNLQLIYPNLIHIKILSICVVSPKAAKASEATVTIVITFKNNFEFFYKNAQGLWPVL